MYIYIYIYIPSGGKTAPGFRAFLKNVVFATAKLLIFIIIMLEFPRGKSGGFYMFSCNLQGMLFSKRDVLFFSLSARHALL